MGFFKFGGFPSGITPDYLIDPGRNRPTAFYGKEGGASATYTDPGGEHWYWDGGTLTDSGGAVRIETWDRIAGYLLEPAGANILLGCRGTDMASWSSTNLSTQTANETGIDGVANKAATLGDQSASLGYASKSLDISPNSGPYTVTVAIKVPASISVYPGIEIGFTGTSNKYSSYIVDPTDGSYSVVSGSADDNACTYLGRQGDFALFAVTGTDNADNTSMYVALYPARSTNGSTSSPAATGSNVFDWAQLEYAAFPSSLMDTEGVTIGADLASDGDCSGGTLTTGANWAHDAGNNEYDATASDADLTDAGILTSGKVYRLKVVVANTTGGSFTPKLGGTSGQAITADGTYYQYVIAGGADLVFDATGYTGSIQSYEVKEHGTARASEENALKWTLSTDLQSLFGGESFTAMVLVRFPFSESDADASYDYAIITLMNSITSLMYYNATGAASGQLTSYDHSSYAVATAFNPVAYIWYWLIVQVDADNSQFRVGYRTLTGSVTWSDWEAYDGSYTLGTDLIAGYLLFGPIWFGPMVMRRDALSDSQLEAIQKRLQ